MKALSAVLTLSALLGSAVANPLFQRAACNADNCARAATGTAGGLQSSRLAACSSFFSTTLIPPTSTVFVRTTKTVPPFTETIFVDDVEVVGTTTTTLVETGTDLPTMTFPLFIFPTPTTTTVTPTAVPAFASPCSGAARYSSACSCAGVPRATTTAPRATITRTLTVTEGRTVVRVTRTIDEEAVVEVVEAPTPTFFFGPTSTVTFVEAVATSDGQIIFSTVTEADAQFFTSEIEVPVETIFPGFITVA